MSPPWMPLYVADYRADTAHLSAAEHGAYLLLIMHYWKAGGLPSDDRQLARIAAMSDREWRSARPVVSAFFADDWRHARIERELAACSAKYEKRAEAGRRGGNARAANMQTPSNASDLPEASGKPRSTNHNHNNNPSDYSSLRSEKREGAQSALRREFDDQFWPSVVNKVGRAAAVKAYVSARGRAPVETILLGFERYQRTKPPDRPWLNPATWLNQDRWTDEPAPNPASTNGHSSRLGQRAAGQDALLNAFADVAAESLGLDLRQGGAEGRDRDFRG